MRQMKLIELPSSDSEIDRYRAVAEGIHRSFACATPQAMQKIMAWLSGQPIRRRNLDYFESSELEHELSEHMSPHVTDEFEDGRTVLEYGELLRLPDVWSIAGQGFSYFCNFLLALQATVAAGEGGFRCSDIGTATDRAGARVCYPGFHTIDPGLRSIYEFWNCHVYSDPALAGVMAMAALLNLHPFRDGNGRVARIIFNWTLNYGRQDPVYLPLYEISALSRCGYLIRLRQAQYHANWGPLLHFISMCGRRLFEE